MNLFFKAKAAKTTPKDAIVRLRESLSMLEKREVYLQSKIDAELVLAKQNATKNKRVAIMALKRKKQYEEQVDKIMGSRMTLETQVLAIENANVNLETMNAMRAGADAMKHIHGNLYILVHAGTLTRSTKPWTTSGSRWILQTRYQMQSHSHSTLEQRDRKSTRLNSSHQHRSRMPSSA